MLEPAKLYSRHIFIFPFVWDCVKKNVMEEEENFTIRKDLSQIRKFLKANQLLKEYKFKLHQIDYDPIDLNGSKSHFNTYNEKKYFYEFAHDVLNLNEECLVDTAQFTATLSDEPYYAITVKGINKPFKLTLTDAIANFYNSGVGIVAFFLENKGQYTFDEVLKINEYGRRIYPQFLGTKDNVFTEDPKSQFLPEQIEVKYNNIPENIAIETFGYYDSKKISDEADFVLPKHIAKLLGGRFSEEITVRPVIDDRMYTMCFIRDGDKFNALKGWDDKKQRYHYSGSTTWHRLIFIDDSQPSCKSKIMLPVLNDNATYDRWIDNIDIDKKSTGQLFGITRYSFVILAHPCWFTDNVLQHHFTHQYFQMVLLAIIQRGSLLSFSAEVKKVSRKIGNNDISSKEVELITDLHKNYIIFLNRIFFREVTAQEQGIELYGMLQTNMNIKQEAESLKVEIESLNEFVRNREAHNLTWIASLYLPGALVASVICWFAPDMNAMGLGKIDWQKVALMLILMLFVVSSLIYHKKINKFILRKTNN